MDSPNEANDCGRLRTVLPTSRHEATGSKQDPADGRRPRTFRRWDILAGSCEPQESLLRWLVPSERKDGDSYIVDLGENECGCDGWGRHRIACKHILAAQAALGRMVVANLKDQQ